LELFHPKWKDYDSTPSRNMRACLRRNGSLHGNEPS
jgi:hypothetical protein